jgi:hypothetical protein
MVGPQRGLRRPDKAGTETPAPPPGAGSLVGLLPLCANAGNQQLASAPAARSAVSSQMYEGW